MVGQIDTQSGMSKLRVLLVDDNAAMRGIVRTVLSAFGCTNVFEAASGKSAIEILRTHPVDLIVLDWKMQPVDGITLTRQIRAHRDERIAYLPIIMLTAYAEPSKIQMARDSGITEFLVKPFTTEGLYRRIANVINRPRPYVRTKSFFGPDRRRFLAEFTGEERRVEAPIA
jgi:two-component system chemotaxis response regulator CheY